MGPIFGRGDLSAAFEPFNGGNACRSRTNSAVYSIPENSNGINMLTNQKNDIIYKDRCSFTISELEVWGVSFNK